MVTGPDLTPTPTPRLPDLEAIRHHAGWYIVLGVLLVILGIFALTVPFLFTAAAVLLLGFVLMVGGVSEVIHAFYVRRWGRFLLDLLIGVLYFIVGLMLVIKPLVGAIGLTLLIAVFLIVEGISRIMAAFALHYHGWGWSVVSGIISVLLGALIWAKWPFDTFWVIGVFVGIDLLFAGWSYIIVALAARSAPASTP